jgi:chemotaxis methyl-accepting protein methylase
MISEKSGIKYNVNVVNADVRDLLKFERINSMLEDQDLIYSSGLIDYFSDKISAKMIELLFKKLKKGGALIVGNVSKEDTSMAYTEFLGEWVLNRRSEEEMLRLADKITGDKEMRIEKEQETGMNLFMTITKKS